MTSTEQRLKSNTTLYFLQYHFYLPTTTHYKAGELNVSFPYGETGKQANLYSG
jgi:hypothetical protein